jgi:hypothetical protein
MVISRTGHGGPQGSEMSRLPHFLDNQLTDGGEVVSLMHWPPFTPLRRFLVIISVRGRVNPWATVCLKELGELKNPVTSLGIEPATFWLAAQCLNQVHYHVPLASCYT